MTPNVVLARPNRVILEIESELSPARLHIETLRLSCEILDHHFDSLDDDGFWELAGRYFLRLVLQLEAVDGALRWNVAAFELGVLRRAYSERLSRRGAEAIFGTYVFSEETLLIRLIDHLSAYARKSASAPPKEPHELH